MMHRSATARQRRNLRRRPYTLGRGSSSIHPRRGTVYFSDVVQLRAASKEMKDYRMITTVSRNTGFGQTQSIHYLNVTLESINDSDDDMDSPERGLGTTPFAMDDIPPLSRLRNESLRENRRGSGPESRRKNGKVEMMAANKLSSPVLAYQLLQKLLCYNQLATAKDNAGETALSSMVHNSRCVQSLKDLQKSLSARDEPESNAESRSKISTSGVGTSIGMPTASSCHHIKSFTSLAELMKSQEEETRNALRIDRSVPSVSSSTTPVMGTEVGPGARSQSATTVMPYVSLSDWLDNFFTRLHGTPLEGNLLTESQQVLQNSSSTGGGSGGGESSVDAVLKTRESGDGKISGSSPDVSCPPLLTTSTPKSGPARQSGSSGIAKSSLVSPLTSIVAKEDDKDETRGGGGASVASQILKATAPYVKSSSKQSDSDKTSGDSSSVLECDTDQEDAPKSKKSRLSLPTLASTSNKTSTPGLKLNNSLDLNTTDSELRENEIDSGHTDSSDAVEFDIGEQILRSLMTNWPGIMAAVLGFYPSCVTKATRSGPTNQDNDRSSPSQENVQCVFNEEQSEDVGSLGFCSVHSLDSFTTHLILNCDDSMINLLVSTIVERMNAAIFHSLDGDNQVNLSLLSEDVDFTKPAEEVCILNDHNLALLVGQRFMKSVVRLLGLEHSRVKNAFVEMHQMRQSNAGIDGSSRGDRDRHSVGGGLHSERSSNLFEHSRSLRGRERQTTPTPRKNISATIKHILSQFSWLAVHALAEAAEAASAPVRIGVSKPLGASSVLPEYQGGSRIPIYGAIYSQFSSSSSSQSSQWSLGRQLHVRTPHSVTKRRKGEKRWTHQSFSLLPADGIILRPCPKDHEGDQSSTKGVAGGVASSVVVGASIHDESFDDEFSDMEESITDGSIDVPTTSRVTAHHITPGFVTELSLPPEVTGEIFLDLDPSSSDDESIMEFPPGSILRRTGSQGGTTEGDNIDDIYPFAWALDGRRIGENSDANARPSSPTGGAVFVNSEPTVPLTSIPSIRFGAGFLARSFARFVKDLVDIAKDITDKKTPKSCLKLPPEIVRTLTNSSVVAMEKTWQWVTSVLDVAEGQLRQGQYFETQRHVVSLRSGSSRHHSSIRPGQVARVSRSFVGSTPGEYITYLLRTHAREDKECLPVLDLYGYEHVVYMLDGLIYTINNWPKASTLNQSDLNDSLEFEPTNRNTASENSKMDTQLMEIDDNCSKSTPGTESQYRFFKRTESVTVTMEDDHEIRRHNEQFFGADGTATTLALEQPELAGPPTPWRSQDGRFSQPLNEAYPLAQRPHLLKPFAKKEHLFGTTVSSDTSSDMEKGEDEQSKPRLSVSYSNPVSSPPILVGPITTSWSVEEVQQRWHSAISVFAHIFLAEGPGSERSNFLNAKAGFASRMARFRHLVQQLFDASQLTRDWAGTVSSTLSIRVRRDHLLLDSIDMLKQLVRFHYANSRVKFDGEDGSGPGVNRGFFASLANELKSADMTKAPMNKLGQFFYEPGKKPEQSGLFAPCPFSKSGLSLSGRHSVMSQRRTAFQAIGRFLGLCLWFRYTIPFMVCRHVAKFFLGRELAWHDLAFYNADLYEGLRRMMLDAEEGKDKEEFVATYCCYFEAPLCCQNSDPKLVELIPGGSKIPVTPLRVKEYVRLYAMFLMVDCVKEELQAMKDGLNDVIPSDLLSGLTAEDFQLLLSGGSADINISRLKSVIHFNHTHGNSTTVCDRFEKMFWRVVSHMTNSQRQQLLYFATGSATLPASSDSNARNPAVAITIDVISSSSIDSLPVASTCSQRMSIPLYPSYHILKKKLLQAVQCQAYGLG